MSDFHTIETVKAEVRKRDASLSALRQLANETSFDETDQDKRIVGVAVESVYRDDFAPTVAGLSCDELTTLNLGAADGNGYYYDRASRAESNAISRELERRHPDIEPTDTYDRDSAVSYGEHERQCYMAATPCESHERKQ